MKNRTKKPSLYVIAGPNGSGKTTFSKKFLRDYVECLEFVNVDLIAKGLSPFTPERAILQAGRVWIIGHALLSNHFKWHLFVENFENQIKKDEWKCMWAVVALCHDVGYPLAAIDKINQQARNSLRNLGLTPSGDLRFAFSQQMLPFHDTIIKFISSNLVNPRSSKYLTHLQNKYYLKLLKSFDRLDHGIVSSLLISKALVYFLESDFSHDDRKPLNRQDARQFMIRREILRAIAAHTCYDIYHLKFNTLSFLLYIVDELQCWGRPTLEELQHPSRGLKEAEAKVTKLSPTEIDIQIRLEDNKWDNDQKEGVNEQLDKLHRMLRLAVGSPKLSPNLYLRFLILNGGGEQAEFLLKEGKITKKAVK